MFPVAAGIATAIWAVNGYLSAQDKDLQQRREAQEVRVREARKPFDDQQLKLYFEAAKVAGILATSNPSSDLWKPNKTRFYALYWSELSMVEDPRVEGAMVNFERSLRNYASGGIHQQVRNQAYCLSHALKASIAKTWTIDVNNGQAESPREEQSRKDCATGVELQTNAKEPDPN